jgi:hypothetical protein
MHLQSRIDVVIKLSLNDYSLRGEAFSKPVLSCAMIRTIAGLVVSFLVLPNLFAQDSLKLPAVWKLPGLDITVPIKLLDLPGKPGTPLKLALRCGAANLPAKAVIVAEAQTDDLTWLINAVDDPMSATPRVVRLATVKRVEQALFMGWAQPLANPVLRRQVANCQLDLRLLGETDFLTIRGTVQLREPVMKASILLDMTEPQQTVDIALADPPPQRLLRLELRELTGFRASTRVRDDSKSVAVGKRAVIELAELPGAEIRAMMQASKSGDVVSVITKAVFREKGKEWDLNLPTLERLVETARRTYDNVVGHYDSIKLPSGSSTLYEARRTAEEIEDDLKDLQNDRPTDITQVGAWRQRHLALSTQLNTAVKRVNALTALAYECEERVRAAPKVKEVLLALHQRATINCIVCVENGETDIVLAEMRQPQNQ